MSTITPQLKFDNVPRLVGQSNYHQWKSAIQIYLRYAQVWTVTSGDEPRPSNGKEPVSESSTSTPSTSKSSMDETTWIQKDITGLAIILNSVSVEWTDMVASKPTAHEAWQALADKFDRQNATTFHHMLSQLCTLQMDDSASLPDHLNTFETLWTRFKLRLANSKPSKLEKAWKTVGDSLESKATFLLRSLPQTQQYLNIIDNLTTKDDITYDTVYARLLDLHSNIALDSSTIASKALVVGDLKGRKKQPQRLSNTRHSENRKPSTQKYGPNECSFCGSRGYDHIGHIHGNCKRLLEWKASNSGKARKTQGPPADTPSSTTPNGVILIAHGLEPSSSPAHARKARNLQQVWVLDTGATHHIAADFSSLIRPTPFRFPIEVGGGRVYHSSNKGNVKLVLDISGQDLEVTFTDVLFVPDWDNTSLISWRCIALKETTYVYGKSNWIEVRSEKDDSILLRTQLENGLFRLQLSAGYTKKATLMYWHRALGHTNPRSWSNTEVFADGKIIPKVNSSFFCSTCALSNSTSTPYSSAAPQSELPDQLIHSDLASPSPVQSLGKAKHYVTFVDDKSRYGTLSFLQKKSQTFSNWKAYC